MEPAQKLSELAKIDFTGNKIEETLETIFKALDLDVSVSRVHDNLAYFSFNFVVYVIGEEDPHTLRFSLSGRGNDYNKYREEIVREVLQILEEPHNER